MAAVGAAADIAAYGVGLAGGEETVAAYKDTYHITVFAYHQCGIAEAVFAAGAFGDGDGFAPGAAVVGAAARDDVDVLREVGLVILAAVAGDEERAVGEAADGRDAPVSAAVVARTEEALLVVLDGLGRRKGVGRVGYVDGGLLAAECQQNDGDEDFMVCLKD